MTDSTTPPDNANQDSEQVEQAVEQVAMVGVFALIILCYACVAALVLGGLALVVLRLVAP